MGTQLVSERAKIILDELRDLALFTRRRCLQHIGTLDIFHHFFCLSICCMTNKVLPYLGEHFQPVMGGLENESYISVSFITCMALLNCYCFVSSMMQFPPSFLSSFTGCRCCSSGLHFCPP